MAPVRAGLACPEEDEEGGRRGGSWSLLLVMMMFPDGVFPSPTALCTSRRVLFCSREEGMRQKVTQQRQNTELLHAKGAMLLHR